MVCPECWTEMIHQNSIDLDDETLMHEYHCQDCLIDVQKHIKLGSETGE